MNHPHDPIEDALRAPAYLEDGEFTTGVMEALPPRRARPRGAVLLVAGTVAAGLGAATLGEPVAAAMGAIGSAGTAGVLLLGAALAAAAGALLGIRRAG